MKLDIRQRILDDREKIYSKYAFLDRNSKGRVYEESPSEVRGDFQRDRDRIIHSKSFRRLKHKTQVFISPEIDHYRTRLTHTLEVCQIARTIARGLRLNEDLVEAIALGHDLGHTPFGHIGEEALNKLNPNGFKHYLQSKKVVEYLERTQKPYPGLNLTFEVIDGIVNHSKDRLAKTLEGKLVKYSDRIAYINHDFDDAKRAGILKDEDIPLNIRKTLGYKGSDRLDTLVKDIIYNSYDKDFIAMSKEVEKSMAELREFMFERVYLDKKVKKEAKKAEFILEQIYNYYLKDLSRLPKSHLEIYEKYKDDDQSDHRIVTDYVAGMTDKYASYIFSDLFIPKSWGYENWDFQKI